MKKLLFILLIVLSASFTFSQWIQQPSSTSKDLLDIKFSDNGTGIIVGNRIILYSNDSGQTWNSQDFAGVLLKCGFQSKDSVWAVGITPTYRNLIAKSTNAEINWNIIDTSEENHASQGIFFVDKNHGWIGGGDNGYGTGSIQRTVDGGNTWNTFYLDTSYITDVFFLGTLNGWACSEFGQIYKTTDGGQSWNLNKFISIYPPYSEPMRKIFFTSPDSGWSVGGIAGDQIIARTTNGGTDWIIDSTQGSSLHGLWFTDSQYGWAVGGANEGIRILRTSNGGESWELQSQPIPYGNIFYFESVYMFNSQKGFVVGDSGVILTTSNGGVTEVKDIQSIEPNKFELYQNYPNPFNPTTKIGFRISDFGLVTLKVYDMLGKRVATLINEVKSAGEYNVEFNGSNLSSGIYFYRLQAGRFSETKKLILLK